MIKNIGWTLGNDCPCRCKHCYSFSVRQKGQNLTKEIVDKVIEQIEKLNVETVNLGGNEPIFTNGLDVKNSMLPYILKELNKRNIKVGITTAGISLIALKNTYPECLELLNDVDSAEVLKVIASFNKTILNAMRKNEPHIITRFVLDLAQAFNKFYHDNSILVEDA